MKKVISVLLSVIFIFSAFSVLVYADNEETTAAEISLIVPGDTKVDFYQRVTIECAAPNNAKGNYIAVYKENDLVKKVPGGYINADVGNLGNTTTYTVKVLDSNGNVVKDKNGSNLEKNVTVNVNRSFFVIIKAFFAMLFGTTKTKAMTISISDDMYKSLCCEYTYEELLRNPDAYNGCLVKYSGTVSQVSESTGSSEPTIYITSDENWNATVVGCYNYGVTPRIIEGDDVVVYGEFKGVTTYDNFLGMPITATVIQAKIMQTV